jgi:hypothetical protein
VVATQAAIWAREREPSRARICSTWDSAVRTETDNCAAIARSVVPSATNCATSCCRRVSGESGRWGAARDGGCASARASAAERVRAPPRAYSALHGRADPVRPSVAQSSWNMRSGSGDRAGMGQRSFRCPPLRNGSRSSSPNGAVLTVLVRRRRCGQFNRAPTTTRPCDYVSRYRSAGETPFRGITIAAERAVGHRQGASSPLAHGGEKIRPPPGNPTATSGEKR